MPGGFFGDTDGLCEEPDGFPGIAILRASVLRKTISMPSTFALPPAPKTVSITKRFFSGIKVETGLLFLYLSDQPSFGEMTIAWS